MDTIMAKNNMSKQPTFLAEITVQGRRLEYRNGLEHEVWSLVRNAISLGGDESSIKFYKLNETGEYTESESFKAGFYNKRTAKKAVVEKVKPDVFQQNSLSLIASDAQSLMRASKSELVTSEEIMTFSQAILSQLIELGVTPGQLNTTLKQIVNAAKETANVQ